HTRLQGDWSSDVCSSDLLVSRSAGPRPIGIVGQRGQQKRVAQVSLSVVQQRVNLCLRQEVHQRLPEGYIAVRKTNGIDEELHLRSEERRVGKECRCRCDR